MAQAQKCGMLTAKELTGAPLISYVPKNRKLKKKTSEPVGREKLMLRHAEAFTTSAISSINNNNNHVSNNNNNGMEQQDKGGLRQRHASDHCQQQQQRFGHPPSQFYVGQNLYHKLLQDHSQANIQDFYRNPAFSGFRHAVQQQQQQQQQHHHQQQQQHPIARRDHPISKSFDNLSDTFS